MKSRIKKDSEIIIFSSYCNKDRVAIIEFSFQFMRTNQTAKRTLPNTSLPPLKRPFNGIREDVSIFACILFEQVLIFFQPVRLYDRTRHLDLTTCMENLALVKRTLQENEGNQIPDEWRVSSY